MYYSTLKMFTPALHRFLSVLSLAAITTTIVSNPVVAEPTTYQGSKGTYTIDLQAGTYRGCLDSGGCISLDRKYLIKNTNPEFTGIRWKNGEYVYEINEGALNVSQNGRIIFQDRVSTLSAEVGQVDRSQPLKVRKANTVDSCSSFSECNRAVDRNPQNSYAYLSRAKFYQSRREATNALADYDKAIEVDPQNFDAYMMRAIYKQYLGGYQTSEILSDFDRAIEINPRNSDSYLSRADFKRERKEATGQEILSDYDRSIEINPRNSDAYLRRASFKRSQNNDRDALADCHLAKKYAVTSDSKTSSMQCINEIEYR